MQDKILSGVNLANQILDDITIQVQEIVQKKFIPATLAVILVGHDPASKVYVKNKKNACTKVGINSLEYVMPDTTAENELINLIKSLNVNSKIHAILVQLPLPKHINSKIIIDTILPSKDVDGFSRYNMGSLAINDAQIRPCTPQGIMYMLDSIKLDYFGLNAVIIGSSTVVGRPMALELINRGASVTICNSKTKNLPQISAIADLLIVAVGRPKMIESEWVKDGSIVIDVGINRDDQGKLCGDVNFEEVLPKVKYITPVPGGVGKMTIAILMQNTLKCYKLNTNN